MKSIIDIENEIHNIKETVRIKLEHLSSTVKTIVSNLYKKYDSEGILLIVRSDSYHPYIDITLGIADSNGKIVFGTEVSVCYQVHREISYFTIGAGMIGSIKSTNFPQITKGCLYGMLCLALRDGSISQWISHSCEAIYRCQKHITDLKNELTEIEKSKILEKEDRVISDLKVGDELEWIGGKLYPICNITGKSVITYNCLTDHRVYHKKRELSRSIIDGKIFVKKS